MNRIISRNKSYVVQDKKTNQGGDNIGRIVIMEFKTQDSTAFDDMLAFVKQHPDFEKLEISYEPTLSLSGLEINLSRRRVINNGQEIELTVKEYDILCLLAANKGRVLTYEQIYDKVWGEISAGNEKDTVGFYIRNLRKKLCDTNSHFSIDSVLFFYTDLINNQGLQINTLETINTVLRPTFQLAVRDDIIRKNPVDGAYCEVKKRNGGARKTRRALTVDQQRKFMEYVAKNPFFYHWYPFFVFLLGTGCRIGEAIGIRWDDIDLENRVIDINHSLTYYQRADDSYKCEFRVSLPKTEAGNRRIPMMQQVYDVLQEEYERQKQEGFCVENVDGMTNFVFTNRFGMPHNPAAVNRAIKRIVDTHNSEEEVAAKKEKREPVMIPRFSCHIFRHTFASRFCENETNIKVIQEVMGHADVSTTMNIYAEANPDVTKSVIEKLSKNMDIF